MQGFRQRRSCSSCSCGSQPKKPGWRAIMGGLDEKELSRGMEPLWLDTIVKKTKTIQINDHPQSALRQIVCEEGVEDRLCHGKKRLFWNKKGVVNEQDVLKFLLESMNALSREKFPYPLTYGSGANYERHCGQSAIWAQERGKALSGFVGLVECPRGKQDRLPPLTKVLPFPLMFPPLGTAPSCLHAILVGTLRTIRRAGGVERLNITEFWILEWQIELVLEQCFLGKQSKTYARLSFDL